jgi:hypothetical protein
MSAKASSAALATVTSGALKTASSQQSGSARMASSATVFFTRIQTCNLSGRASSRASAIVTPSLQAQAMFGSKASMASSRSIAFIIKAQFQSSARLSDISTGPIPDCVCPPWQIGPTLVDTWTPDSSCNLDFQSLPYTLPIFRLYMLARLGFSYKNDPTLANTWISDSDTCNVPSLLYTIPIFRLYGYINLSVNYKTEQTLTNQWGRNGCQ